jgi:hypothetical protein
VFPEDAVTFIQTNQPIDIVILDGWHIGASELVKAIRSNLPQARIVLDDILAGRMSAAIEAYKTGCDYCTAKHFSPEEIIKEYQKHGIIPKT